MEIKQIIILITTFLFVAIFSILIEKGIGIVNSNHKRPTSKLFKQKTNRNLLRYPKRTILIALRYLEIIILAIVGIFLNKFILWGVAKTFIFLIPIYLMFVPISFWIVTMCVPKTSFDFFKPKTIEWFITGGIFLGGLIWLILMVIPK